MNDFFTAAFPWVVLGLCLAFFAAHAAANKKRRSQSDAAAVPGDYLLEGTLLGLAAGALLGFLGAMPIGSGVSAGMFLGEVIGMLIPKRQ